jgi:hypothetical protein
MSANHGWEGWRFHPAAGTPKHGPTLDKPQTKAFYAFDSWWALLVRSDETVLPELALFELGEDQHSWRDSGTTLSRTALATADAHFDGEVLWVALRAPGVGVSLQRLRFDHSQRSWLADPGGTWEAPDFETPSVSIATGADGQVWVSFCAKGLPWYSGGPTSDFPRLPEAAPVPGATATLRAVDLSALVAFEDGVALLWSDQGRETFFFGVPESNGAWSIEVAAAGGLVADDHIAGRNHKGRLFFAIKTSRDDDPSRAADDSLLMLLVREPDGRWHDHKVVSVDHPVTRPIPLIEPKAGLVHVLYTHGPNPGVRAIHSKSARLEELEFPDGPGEVVIAGIDAEINDVTSSREPLTEAHGAILLASDGANRRYYFRYLNARVIR